MTGEGGLIKQDLIEKFGKYELLSENIEHAYYREPSEPFYEIKNAFWKFDGIILNVKNIHPTSNNTYWVEKASIISNKHLQNFPLKIGDSIDKAQCFFGRFLIRDRKNKNVSYTNFSDSIDVRISFNDYLLVDKIDFEYFTD